MYLNISFARKLCLNLCENHKKKQSLMDILIYVYIYIYISLSLFDHGTYYNLLHKLPEIL